MRAIKKKQKIIFVFLAFLLIISFVVISIPSTCLEKIKIKNATIKDNSFGISDVVKNKEGLNFKINSADSKFMLELGNLRIDPNGKYLISFELDNKEMLQDNEMPLSDDAFLVADFSNISPGWETSDTFLLLRLSNFLLYSASEKRENFIVKKSFNLKKSINYKNGEIFFRFFNNITGKSVFCVREVKNLQIFGYRNLRFVKILFLFLLMCLFIFFLKKSEDSKIWNLFASFLLVFFVVSLFYFSPMGESFNIYTPDNGTYYLTGTSILNNGNSNMDFLKKIKNVDNVLKNYEVFIFPVAKSIKDHFVSVFPDGPALFYVPTIIINRFLNIWIYDLVKAEIENNFIYSILIILLIYSLTRFYLKKIKINFILTIISFLLLSPLFFYEFWSENALILMLFVAIFFIKKGEEKGREKLVLLSAIPTSLMFFMRPISALIIICIGIYIILKHKKIIAGYFFIGMIFFVLFLFISKENSGSFFPLYYTKFPFYGIVDYKKIILKFLSILFSPNWGMFTYVSIFLFSFLGFKISQKNSLEKILFYSFPMYVIYFSFCSDWAFGYGNSYGPRVMWDLFPIFLLLLFFLIGNIKTQKQDKYKKIISIIFIVLLIFSVLVQNRTYYSIEYTVWNEKHIWPFFKSGDFSKIAFTKDPQIFYGIKNDIQKIFYFSPMSRKLK